MKKWIALGFAIAAAAMLLLLPATPKKQYYHHQGNIFGTYYNIRYEATEDLHEQIKQRLQELKSDKEDLEKFARERYRMHAPNEDVYVVEYE